MVNPAMEVDEAKEIAYANAPMTSQLRETPHDNRQLRDQVFVTDGVDGSDWSLDESDGVSGQVPDWYDHNLKSPGTTGGGY